jgi:hypothetical protein
MKAKFLGLLACTAIGIVAAGPSHALSLVGTTSDASGIDGLVVDGVTYDVTFANGSYNTVYSITAPTFLGNSSGSVDAANALASAMNALGVTDILGVNQMIYGQAALFIPDAQNSDGSFDAQYVELVSPPQPQSSFGWFYLSGNTTYGFVEISSGAIIDDGGFAVFTAVSGPTTNTPLPAALPLFATGLGGLALLGWRRKRKTQAMA